MPIHISLLYAGLAGLLLVILSFNVMQNWVRVTGKGNETDRGMRRAERVLSSFVEYVPLGIVLLSLIESKGAYPLVVHGLGLALVAGRMLHAYGSNDMPGSDLMRFVGAQLTYLMLAVASLACLYYYAL
jgi:uncharacterized protein